MKGPVDDELIAELNITPLTDIFLVLLVIFMVTSTTLSQQGQREVPRAGEGSGASQGVLVAIDAHGSIRVNNGEPITKGIEQALAQALKGSRSKVVVLEGDREAYLGRVVEIMDAAKKAGASQVAIATQK